MVFDIDFKENDIFKDFYRLFFVGVSLGIRYYFKLGLWVFCKISFFKIW